MLVDGRPGVRRARVARSTDVPNTVATTPCVSAAPDTEPRWIVSEQANAPSARRARAVVPARGVCVELEEQSTRTAKSETFVKVARTIGVCPPAEREKRKRLFGGLESAFCVGFEGREPAQLGARVVAAISFEDLDPEPFSHPCFIAVGEPRRRPGNGRFRCLHASRRPAAWAHPRRHRAVGVEGIRADGNAVHASCGGNALWIRRGAVQRVALAPEELLPGESLRDLFAPGRWLSLLPLVHFLREVSAGSDWQLPATGPRS